MSTRVLRSIVAIASLLAGCDVRYDVGDSGTGATRCAQIRERAIACGLAEVGALVCTAVCQDDVDAVGHAGDVVAATCLSCLQSSDCATIASGGCLPSCPNGLFAGGSCDMGLVTCGGA